MSTSSPTTRGRPRIEGDREAEVLSAALEVLAAVGYDRLTLDAVALRSKASKATLYRRWNGKVSLIIDAILHSEGMAPVEVIDTGSLRDDLIRSFCGRGGLTDVSQVVASFDAVVTAMMRDDEFAEAFRRHVLWPKMAAAKAIFARAQKRGDIDPCVDIDLLAPSLAGIVLHRRFLVGNPPDEDLVIRVIDQIILPAAARQPGNQS